MTPKNSPMRFITLALLTTAFATAQTDLTGVWTNATITPLERAAGAKATIPSAGELTINTDGSYKFVPAGGR